MGNIRQGYVLQDDLLFRIWAPRGDGFSGDPIVQVVLPEKFRTSAVQIAHDNVADHIGVTKTYHLVLQHFFWPRV